MFYTNCDCLSQTKRVELESYVQTNSPGIITLTEVLPKNSIFDVNEAVFALKGYSCFSVNLNKGRGVLLNVKTVYQQLMFNKTKTLRNLPGVKLTFLVVTAL